MTLPPDLLIRIYGPRDHDDVWRLHWEGVREISPPYPEVVSDYERDLEEIDATYLTDGSNFWVINGPDGLVGMAAIQRINAETGRLRRMRVTESWRRKGIAQALLSTAEAFCHTSGYSRLILDTTQHQTTAQALYTHNGFRKSGEHDLGPFRMFDYVKDLT
ncbi:MAG: GNAT family N-acetyltransferase [Dehalococcoidia bacterium]